MSHFDDVFYTLFILRNLIYQKQNKIDGSMGIESVRIIRTLDWYLCLERLLISDCFTNFFFNKYLIFKSHKLINHLKAVFIQESQVLHCWVSFVGQLFQKRAIVVFILIMEKISKSGVTWRKWLSSLKIVSITVVTAFTSFSIIWFWLQHWSAPFGRLLSTKLIALMRHLVVILFVSIVVLKMKKKFENSCPFTNDCYFRTGNF